MSKTAFILASLAAAGILAVGCGSSDDSTFGDGPLDGSPDDRNNLPPGAAFDDSEIGAKGLGAACVTDSADAKLAPANLVFMFDKSGSMGDYKYIDDKGKEQEVTNRAFRWDPITSGLKGFFADAGSKRINASLQFFPINDVDIEAACGAPYSVPKVTLTSCANPAPFTTAIDEQTPSGGTPTEPALRGAVAYAKSVVEERPGEATAVVLVTDGEPGFNVNGVIAPGCTDNTVAKVVESAESAKAAGVPVYVIGAGTEKTNMDLIAAGGGTGKAFIVSVSDPTATSAQFTAALADIRSKTVSCTFDIPAPPKGAELDKSKVNVIVVKGSEQTLVGYSQDCSDTSGWQYDNPDAPTRIKLCAQACSDAQKNPDTFVKLAYGCKTQPGTGPR